MDVFPALRGNMGRWQYFTVKMSMGSVAEKISFAHQISDAQALNEAIQRVLDTRRLNGGICNYLIQNEDRFFNSIVIAAIGGSPNFYSVEIADDPRFEVFAQSESFADSFGVVTFSGEQKYYALDGQHRLGAIKEILDPEKEYYKFLPDGFQNETVSVIMVIPEGAEATEEFLVRYRRLFSHLNRFAQKTSTFDNIVIDEDDGFAIATRELLATSDFFKWHGSDFENTRIRMDKSKNMSPSLPHLCSLESFYNYNIALLSSSSIVNSGWPSQDGEGFVPRLADYITRRPSDAQIDTFVEHLDIYWNAIVSVLPDLEKPGHMMRNHNCDPENDEDESTDSALFWPVCQEILIRLVRRLCDMNLDDPEKPTLTKVKNAIAPLGNLNWSMHEVPWRLMALKNDPEDENKWSMRNEDRKPALQIIENILSWQLQLVNLDAEGIKDLKESWSSYLLTKPSKKEVEELWAEIERGCSRK